MFLFLGFLFIYLGSFVRAMWLESNGHMGSNWYGGTLHAKHPTPSKVNSLLIIFRPSHQWAMQLDIFVCLKCIIGPTLYSTPKYKVSNCLFFGWSKYMNFFAPLTFCLKSKYNFYKEIMLFLKQNVVGWILSVVRWILGPFNINPKQWKQTQRWMTHLD